MRGIGIGEIGWQGWEADREFIMTGKLRIKMKMNLWVWCNFHGERSTIVSWPRRELPFFIFFFCYFFIFFCWREFSFRITKQSPNAPSETLHGKFPSSFPSSSDLNCIKEFSAIALRSLRFPAKILFRSHLANLNPHKFFIFCNQRRWGIFLSFAQWSVS